MVVTIELSNDMLETFSNKLIDWLIVEWPGLRGRMDPYWDPYSDSDTNLLNTTTFCCHLIHTEKT